MSQAATVTAGTNPPPAPMHDSQVTEKVTGITVWVTGGVTGNLRYSCESVV